MADTEIGIEPDFVQQAPSGRSTKRLLAFAGAAALALVLVCFVAFGLVAVAGRTAQNDDFVAFDDFEFDFESERNDEEHVPVEDIEGEFAATLRFEEGGDDDAFEDDFAERSPVERQSCNVNGRGGVCQSTSTRCNGAYVAGHCPGASNIRCCVAGAYAACTDTGSKQGVCINTNTQSCSGTIVSGRCPGPANIRCCTARSGGGGSSSSGGGGKGRVDYRGKVISDSNVKAKLQQIAGLFPNSYVYVTSGNRNGNGRSHHDVGRAADFWIPGGGGGANIFNRIRSSGILARDYQIIWHGARTCTSGEHIHIGRYADNRSSCWVHEGTTSSNKCVYRCM